MLKTHENLTTARDRVPRVINVALDARILDLPGGERGFGTYVRELATRLADDVTNVTLLVCSGHEAHWKRVFDNVTIAGLPVRDVPTWLGSHDALRTPELTDTLRTHGCDVFHSPLPVLPDVDMASVVTLLDFIPLRVARYFRRRNVLAGWMQRRSYCRALETCRAADAFVAISESTARDAVDVLGVDRTRMVVSPLAPPAGLARDRTRRSPVGVTDYFLYVGSLSQPEKRRELDVLLEAYAQLSVPARWRTPLVLAGSPGRESQRLAGVAARLGIESTVVMPGYVARDDLAALYSWARCVVFPSTYEGCGLPVLESLRCGVPVITYPNTSLLEVGGALAHFTPPSDPLALAAAMARIAADDDWCTKVAQEGPAFATTFSWETTAERTRTAYRLALELH